MSTTPLPQRMESALTAFARDLAGIRAGRASTALLEPITVSAYGGSKMPINQLAGLSAPDPRTLVVQVWDASQAEAVDKAIRDSGLGLSPQMEGSVIRVNIPPLSEERRAELAKLSSKYAETARIAVRNVRRDGMEALKKREKDGEISQDEHRRDAEQIQKLTDETIGKIDEMLAGKEKEIMAV
ncbi:MAG: ribosome recycling factor [Alphaproteobacteria bacterium]|nr:ribosome recycling factor [Alphaproteobacteria bacterium]MDA7983104.1 ribosome recycling factor [Alphaproteobacteria bacterium]MDA7984360.1 ribosome recycling factor [Alphaproteobacteria bacterium]MDA7989328.1 ribosome recycling factor [Alphaproteobacteria bacterium]MDA8001346.1 ribosome recycling factor [Alphaproteobacteria bacterium]